MTPADAAGDWVIALARLIEDDIAAARDQVASLEEELGSDTGDPPGRPLMAFLAVCIDRAYTAIESGLSRIARGFDRHLPAGRDWHAALLNQMALAIQDRRPAVLSPATAAALDPLRRHRHWLRHSYSSEFDWSRLAPTVAAFGPAIAAATADLEAFLGYLAEVGRAS